MRERLHGADSLTLGIITGRCKNGPGWTTGRLGSALSFDGINDFVSLGTPLSSWLEAARLLTAWIRTAQVGDNTVWLAPGLTGVEQSTALNDVFWAGLMPAATPHQRRQRPGGQKHPAGKQWPVAPCGVNSRRDQRGVKVYVDGLLNSTAISRTGTQDHFICQPGAH